MTGKEAGATFLLAGDVRYIRYVHLFGLFLYYKEKLAFFLWLLLSLL